MASTSRSFSRLARSTPLRALAHRNATFSACQPVKQASRRGFASGPTSSTSGGSSNVVLYSVLGATVTGAAGYFVYSSNSSTAQSVNDAAKEGKKAIKSSVGRLPGTFIPSFEDYQEVYNEVAHRLVEFDDYDDGSYGPVVLRLGWHASGTYDAETGTGGSNGATMRFAPESDHGANAGLRAARDFLQPVKAKFPWITYSDLWTLGTITAIQEMAGPPIPWRPGRADRDESWCTPDGRLPDGAKGAPHLRAIFGRMGFSDQEIVALSGAHALGRCHPDRSGFDGPWTFSPITLTNDYYKLLLDEKWRIRKWNGPQQYQDTGSATLMMLPTDMALVQDAKFKPWVQTYAADHERFFADFAAVVGKLLELGVPFQQADRWRFRSLTEQGVEL